MKANFGLGIATGTEGDVPYSVFVGAGCGGAFGLR